jgi:NADH:ubiquinone reductase (non-electrogenic)
MVLTQLLVRASPMGLSCRYQHLGDMMSLGSSNAAVALPFQLPAELAASINSTPLGSALSLAGVKLSPGSEGLVLEGPLAQLLRRGAYLYRQPTNEQRLNVAASWIEQAVTTAARLAAELSASSNSRDGASTR